MNVSQIAEVLERILENQIVLLRSASCVSDEIRQTEALLERLTQGY